MRRRRRNQHAVSLDCKSCLAGVADGEAGCQGGEGIRPENIRVL